jgi:hypothetical protein
METYQLTITTIGNLKEPILLVSVSKYKRFQYSKQRDS